MLQYDEVVAKNEQLVVGYAVDMQRLMGVLLSSTQYHIQNVQGSRDVLGVLKAGVVLAVVWA